MKRILSAGLAVAVASIAIAAGTRTADSQNLAPFSQGKYLATRVAGCVDCHGANLMGARLPFVPAPGVKIPWASRAPRIAGLPMFKRDSDAVKFLETGVMPDGSRPRPPMPPYALKPSDAKALVAYLRSLK
jgi:mono/diheme cytochrome c family protein